MDGLTFHKMMRIIGREYTGAVLNRISILDQELYLSFYRKNTFVLRFQSGPPPSLEVADVALGSAPGVLSVLGGAKLVAVGGRHYDRVGYFDLEKRRPSGKLMCYRLVFEPMGNYANAFLLNEKGVILFRLTAKTIDPDREIGIGKVYNEPRRNKRYDLDNPGSSENFAEFLGFYPVTSAVAERYQLLYGFTAAGEKLRHELNTGDFFYKNAGGKILPFEDPDHPSQSVPFHKFSFIEKTAQAHGTVELSARLKKFYIKEHNRYRQLYAKLEKELEEAGRWTQLRSEAELLKMNFHLIKGQGRYELTHYSATGAGTVSYYYESTDAPGRYIDKLYKRAGKLMRSIAHIQARLQEVGQLVQSASEQIYYVENAQANELKELTELLKKRPAVNISKNKPDQKEFYEYAFQNARLYIGRNSASNHRLVFGFAGSSDVWLHTHNIPSAHCIIRSETPPSDDLILYAARLVAAFSRNKYEKRVPVDFTLKKYVKKPKNTPLGFVTYTHFKTVNVEPLDADEVIALQ